MDMSAKGSGESDTALRYVPAQPVQFSKVEATDAKKTLYNVRKLSQLPGFLMGAAQFELLKSECLMNYEFLRGSISALGIRSVLQTFREACELTEQSSDLVCIQETLQLAQDALQYAPEQLAGQLIGRLGVGAGRDEASSPVGRLLQECRNSASTVLIPNECVLAQPGGQLRHTLSGHTKEVTHCRLNSGGTLAVTCEHSLLWHCRCLRCHARDSRLRGSDSPNMGHWQGRADSGDRQCG